MWRDYVYIKKGDIKTAEKLARCSITDTAELSSFLVCLGAWIAKNQSYKFLEALGFIDEAIQMSASMPLTDSHMRGIITRDLVGVFQELAIQVANINELSALIKVVAAAEPSIKQWSEILESAYGAANTTMEMVRLLILITVDQELPSNSLSAALGSIVLQVLDRAETEKCKRLLSGHVKC